jgi:Na+/melibiose symporter-like transporter
MIVDAVDDGDLKTGVRTDGTAFSLNGLGGLIGTALGGALGIAIIGWYGYVAGQEITEQVKTGIIIATNVMPAIIFVLSLIPVACYKLKESDMPEIREKLRIRNEQRDLERMK